MKNNLISKMCSRVKKGLQKLTAQFSPIKLEDMEVIPFIQPVHDGRNQKLIGVEISMKLFDGQQYHCVKRCIEEIEHREGSVVINEMVISMILNAEKELMDLSKKAPKNFFISFTFSAEQLYCNEVFNALISLRRKISDRCRIVIEIKESSLPEYDDELVDIFEKLRLQGVDLSLTDFGKYSSSLLYLEHAGFSSLKMDHAVALAYKGKLVNKRLVKSIVSATQDLGMIVEADGVESEEQYRLLIDCGVTHMQGSFFSKPTPLKGGITKDFFVSSNSDK
ncbi:EAL domain-containing protein [Lelliottia nimipressuralis]|uniref:EAL domain-containing protein n=1 Tax=Lelliottia nimipressuralis TaxID=69220 RepID=A0ABY3NXC3_9ENTR|nr:EAL domain-containing protein [Lelliottia nimipressuralis]RXJ10773.1 EAL domain-containing protein [Lelliottia nimipressuralis]TYT29274.1 EAL domain-containing protein [Lelliottia nimipressuralis]